MKGILILTILAFLLSILLVLVDTYLNKKENHILEIEKRLPGLNCGACGYSGCKQLAISILKDPTLAPKCRLLKGKKLENMQEYLNRKKE